MGFMVIDAMVHALHQPLNFEKKNLFIIGAVATDNERLILAKPLTYMNGSGAAVSELCQMFEISMNNLLVLCDDFNLPFGKLRLRSNGSDGGHNGLASIIDKLGTADFARLRIGIGHEHIDNPVDFVLSPFNEPERKELKTTIRKCVQACSSFVADGIQTAMKRFN